ncbi:sigma-70 family RNA polymerase sigma factor [Aporhodopirellula aestuarii]|uniref:Sigma-70 family RNA polymerase sigma factor n=1 Tax=Aporhodopirellula aestuarii TaxID=2950107 RepID=A0ABT0UA37_9BACT|nr:sigma-70 family RNA polymerase sigma factor [Aporhodopirellula aestuarii]MCM2373641.1 sigma-70 family RNA polymerase sigma factor [Aporhodopirellula aestuarii]
MHTDSENVQQHEPYVRALTKYERVVRAYIRNSGVSCPNDVDEIMQEVSLVAWKKLDQLRDIEEFPRWICVIAKFEILRFRRARARDRLVLNEDVLVKLAEESLEELSLSEMRLDQLQTCLDKLPEVRRRLVTLAYSTGAPFESLARSVGKKTNALYQELWRVRRGLRLCVEHGLKDETTSREYP